MIAIVSSIAFLHSFGSTAAGLRHPRPAAGAFRRSHCKIRRSQRRLVRTGSAVLAAVVLAVPCARAADDDEPRRSTVVSGARFLAGAAVALAAHESGHLVLDAAFGARPSLKRVDFGGIPFFAIAHRPVSPRREFAISSAGFWVQHATDEWLLLPRSTLGRARTPACRQSTAAGCRPGPFAAGMFAFNVLASVGYSMAAFAEAGPAERDTRSIAASARVSERLVGAAILAPALVDAYRYYRPESRAAKWISRAAKAAGALLIVR